MSGSRRRGRCLICGNYNSKPSELPNDDISFHKFPQDPTLQNLWKSKCTKKFASIKNNYVCSLHFRQTDFVHNLKAELLGIATNRRILKPDAIPSVNLCSGSNSANDSLDEDIPKNSDSLTKKKVGISDLDSFNASWRVKVGILCRLCGNSDYDCVPIFSGKGMEAQVVMKVQSYLNIQLLEGDGMPDQVCPSCMTALESWHKYVEDCYSVAGRLRELLGIQEVDQSKTDKTACLIQDVVSTPPQLPLAINTPQLPLAVNTPQMPLAINTPQLPLAVNTPQLPLAVSSMGSTQHVEQNSINQVAYILPQVKQEVKIEFNSDDTPVCDTSDPLTVSSSPLDNPDSLNNDNHSFRAFSNSQEDTPVIETNQIFLLQDPCYELSYTPSSTITDLPANSHQEVPQEIQQNVEICHPENNIRVAEVRNSSTNPLSSVEKSNVHNITANVSEEENLVKKIKEENELTDSAPETLLVNSSSMVKVEPTSDKVRRKGRTKVPGMGVKHYVNTLYRQKYKVFSRVNHIKYVRPIKEVKPRTEYQCKICSVSFPTQQLLAKHRSRDHMKPVIQCRFCASILYTVHGYKRHVKICSKSTLSNKDDVLAEYSDPQMYYLEKGLSYISSEDKIISSPSNRYSPESNKTNFLCELCGMLFEHKSFFESHLEIHEKTEPRQEYSCDMCKVSFPFKYRLKRHMLRCHFVRDRNTPCETCGKLFNNSQCLRSHLMVHSNDRPFVCSICGKTFKWSKNLNQHKIIHLRTLVGQVRKRSRKIQCDHCHKHFYSKFSLISHLERITNDPSDTHVCHICGEMLLSKWRLTSHLLKHSGKLGGHKCFTCQYCGKNLTSKMSLLIHERSHTGEKPFQCHVCDKKFSAKSSLDAHFTTHTHLKTYKCRFCGKCFRRGCHLNTHERIHTGDKRYKCGTCSHAFVQKHDMIKHMLTHFSEKPFSCHCGITYRQKRSLIQHQKKCKNTS